MLTLQRYSILVLFFALTFFSCKKEKSWYTEVGVVDVSATEARLLGNFLLPRNDNYVYVGICWAEGKTPTFKDAYMEQQQLDSGEETFLIQDLLSNTTYTVRTFIRTSEGEYIYSDPNTFTTSFVAEAPCILPPGKVYIDGSSYSLTPLNGVQEDDYYRLSASCAYGEFDIKFGTRPTKDRLYKTKSSASYLAANEVSIDGILGGGWLTCYYRPSENKDIYVSVSEADKINVSFCEMEFWPSGSCETLMVFGDFQE